VEGSARVNCENPREAEENHNLTEYLKGKLERKAILFGDDIAIGEPH